MSEASKQIFWNESLQKLKWIQSQVEGSYRTDGTNSSWIELPYTVKPDDRISLQWRFISLPLGANDWGIVFGGGDARYGSWRVMSTGVRQNGKQLYNTTVAEHGSIALGSFSSAKDADGIVTTTGIGDKEQDERHGMTVFVQNESSINSTLTLAHQFVGELFWMKIVRGDQLLFDLIPCICKGEVGLVNAVDSAFYGSKSSVPFIAGERA